MPKNHPAPICDCGQPAKLIGICDVGYPYRQDYGAVWACLPCQAWVGTHKGTNRAKGSLATEDLRAARRRAHAAFDPLWQRKMQRDGCSKGKARAKGYQWLAGQLGIEPNAMHIAMLDAATCDRVVEIIQKLRVKRQ